MTASSTLRDPAPGRFRLIDKVALAYFALITLLLIHPNRPDNWPTLLLFHSIYLVGIPAAVRWSHSSAGSTSSKARSRCSASRSCIRSRRRTC